MSPTQWKLVAKFMRIVANYIVNSPSVQPTSLLADWCRYLLSDLIKELK